MRSKSIQTPQKWTFPSALMLSCLALAACGGGGSSSPVASSLSGSVIDGYIEGAEVCLDLNNNLACDAGEPKDTTGKDGSYKLDTTGLSTDQIKAAHLLTNVPTTAKDADDLGKTLVEAGKSAFNLLAPAAAYVNANGTTVTGAVISPLTTLVSHDMLTSNTPLTTAQSYVRTRLNLADSTDLTQDFVARKDTALAEKAQMLTAAIGQVKADALADKTVNPTDKQALFAALQYLQTQSADLQKAVDAAKTINSSAKPVALVKTAIQNAAAKPVIADLVAEAKKVTDSSSVSSANALIEQGFYSGNNLPDSCSINCTPEYLKIQGVSGKIPLDNSYILNATGWLKASSDGNSWVLSSKGWVLQTVCATGQSNTYTVGSDGVTTVSLCSGITVRVSSRKVDASGKTLAALGLNTPKAYASTTMPAGSELYWLKLSETADQYYLHTSYKLSDFSVNGSIPFTSLDAFIQKWVTPTTTGSTNYYGRGGLNFSFDAGGTKDGGKLTLWSGSSVTTPGAQKIGTATYKRKTVYGQEVLIIEAQAPQDPKGVLIMFAAKDGYVYGGSYQSVAESHVSEAYFNKTMLNAILAAGKLPNVLD